MIYVIAMLPPSPNEKETSLIVPGVIFASINVACFLFCIQDQWLPQIKSLIS